MSAFARWFAVVCLLVPVGPMLSGGPALALPSYEIIRTENLSFAGAKRLNVRVVVARQTSHAEIQTIAERIVAQITKRQQVNAISIMFYGPGAEVTGPWELAGVDWAPNGNWNEANTVAAGDYRNFKYATSFAALAPTAPTSLEPQTAKGLLGTPLPRGAVLKSKTKGDVAAGVDPREQYAINSSAETISTFFYRELTDNGWVRAADSTERMLFFDRGAHTIAVIIAKDGKSFTLMGE